MTDDGSRGFHMRIPDFETWKYLFPEAILERGEEYFQEGLMDQVEETEHGWKALAYGTGTYQVEVQMEGERIKKLSCTCPYAKEGRRCKHEAGLLFMLTETNQPADQDQNTTESIDEIIDRMKEEELQNELKQLVQEQSYIYDRIFSKYRKQKAGMADVNRIYQVLDSLAYEYGDRHGFIDWNSGSDYECAFSRSLEDLIVPLIDHQEYMIAFKALDQAFYVLNTVEMDGSSGEHTMIAHEIQRYLDQVIHLASEKERDEMHAWLEEMEQNSDHMICGDTITELLQNSFDDPKYITSLLEEVREQLNDPDLPKYSLKKLLPRYRDLLLRSGEVLTEYDEWLDQHADLEIVKEIRLEDAKNRNDIPTQIAILENLASEEKRDGRNPVINGI